MIQRILLFLAIMALPAAAAAQAPPAADPMLAGRKVYAMPVNIKQLVTGMKIPASLELADSAKYGVCVFIVSLQPNGEYLGHRVTSCAGNLFAYFMEEVKQVRYILPKEGGATANLEAQVALFYPAPDPQEPDPKADVFVPYQVQSQPLNKQEVIEKIGFPTLARQRGETGRVVVRVLVDGYGYYLEHEVISSPGPILQGAVEDNLYQLRFLPAFMNNRPVKAWVTMNFDFK